MLKLEQQIVKEEDLQDPFLTESCQNNNSESGGDASRLPLDLLKHEKDTVGFETDELELEDAGNLEAGVGELDPLGDIEDYQDAAAGIEEECDEAIKNEDSFKCPICRMCFASLAELCNHCQISGHKRFLCELCPEKYFEMKSGLHAHRRREHFEAKECEACKQLCTSYHQYQWHMVKHFGKTYDCSVCQKKFSKQSKLSEHMNGHTGETPYRCEKCNLGFRYKISYMNHNTRKHLMVDDDAHEEENKKLKFKCSFCEKRFGSSKARAAHTRCYHTKTASNKCKQCKMCFPNSQRLETHEIVVHAKKSPYRCDKCDRKPFTSKGGLTRHLKSHEKKKNTKGTIQNGRVEIKISEKPGTESQKSTNQQNEKESDEDEPQFIPQITEKDMKILVEDFKIEVEESINTGLPLPDSQQSSNSLFAAFSGHQDIPIGEDDSVTGGDNSVTGEDNSVTGEDNSRNNQTSFPDDPSRKHKCRFCGMGFRAKYRVSEHERTHTGEKPFECPLCKKKFSTKRNLSDHDKLHTNAYTIFCDVCGRGCRDTAYLRHHKKTHSDEKPFKCPVCKKGFTASFTLTDHLRLHTGEKPFKCDICLKTFAAKSALSKHHRRNHLPKNKLECDMCGVVFSRKIQFTRHMVLVHDRRDFPEVKTN